MCSLKNKINSHVRENFEQMSYCIKTISYYFCRVNVFQVIENNLYIILPLYGLPPIDCKLHKKFSIYIYDYLKTCLYYGADIRVSVKNMEKIPPKTYNYRYMCRTDFMNLCFQHEVHHLSLHLDTLVIQSNVKE